MPPSTKTWQQRNALAELPAIPPLAKGALTYTPGKPQFSDLANSILGNVGTGADGFDALFNLVASTIDSDIAAVPILDTILADVGFVAGALDAAVLAPIAAEHAAFLAGGQASLAGVDAGFGGGSAPPPPPPPSGTKPGKPQPQPTTPTAPTSGFPPAPGAGDGNIHGRFSNT
ncbi:MAG TPA: hypothetical protein VNZ03_14870 [Terriglobales bacterium]|nr:hypothetical protein [Terriglobales bacterium]